MEFFDIILIGMIAAFVLLRLRSELGNKTGNEPMPPAPGRSGETSGQSYGLGNQPQEPSRSDHNVLVFDADPAVRRSLSEIRRADTRFDPVQFMEGAEAAYRMILEAFWAGDKETLKDFLSDDVYSQFSGAIEAREADGTRLDNRLLEITKADISEARLVGKMAELTVSFVSELIAVTRDSDGRAIEGNLSDAITVNDIWTFSHNTRSRDPNWILIATRTG